MTDVVQELADALAARDRSRRALAPTQAGTPGRRKRRAKTKAQRAARKRSRG